eukprot:TRINITY_DN8573_c0_g1_i2.p1 TRINITY_DN8573_c0_g1~~TRINITY_DN8573_c0_g1_i2.p1  ORF type:complete len:101 (+),score=19.92 TRINITY_DN8573_c0_g1_i2:155-457(+)
METMANTARQMTHDIAAVASHINDLIVALPGINATKPQQMEQLRTLEGQSQELAKEIQLTLETAEQQLAQVQAALQDIYLDRMADTAAVSQFPLIANQNK